MTRFSRIFWLAGLVGLGLWGCREEEGGARVRVPLAGYAREGVHPVYLFAVEGERVARFWRVDGTEEGVEVDLPLGRYGLGVIAGAGTRDEVRLEEGYALEEVELCLTEREGYFREASDAWTGWAEVKVEEGTRVLPAVSLARQTAGLEVRVTGIPEGVTNPWLVVLPVATERSFTGRTGMGRGHMAERMEVVGEGEATGVVRLFPTREGMRVYVAYSTERETLHKRLPDLPALDTGEVAQVACVFGDLPDEEPGGGTEEEVPHGVNLLVNGDFEWWTPGALAPDGWFLYRDGRDSAVVGVTGAEAFSGEGAVRLEGKTYLYQDVEVEAGGWYAIRMRVNAPGNEVRWRCYCSWRKNKSTALEAEYNEEIRTLNYQRRTEGWVEVFPGRVFQAPAEARLLRVELRTYGEEWVYGKGVYVDDCSVERVDAGD